MTSSCLRLRPDEIERLTAMVGDEMRGALPLAVPIVVETGVARNWLAAHS